TFALPAAQRASASSSPFATRTRTRWSVSVRLRLARVRRSVARVEAAIGPASFTKMIAPSDGAGTAAASGHDARREIAHYAKPGPGCARVTPTPHSRTSRNAAAAHRVARQQCRRPATCRSRGTVRPRCSALENVRLHLSLLSLSAAPGSVFRALGGHRVAAAHGRRDLLSALARIERVVGLDLRGFACERFV